MFDHQLQVLDCLHYVLLAIFEEPPPLIAGRQVVVGDDVVDPMQHPPLIVLDLWLLRRVKPRRILLARHQLFKQWIHRLQSLSDSLGTYIKLLQGDLHVYQSLIQVLLIEQPRAFLDMRIYLPA